MFLQAEHNGDGRRDAKWSDLHSITVRGYAQFGSSAQCRCRRCLGPRRVDGAARDLLGAAGDQDASGQEQATGLGTRCEGSGLAPAGRKWRESATVGLRAEGSEGTATAPQPI